VFGHVFNPASFYLCRDGAGDLRAVVVEVHNTHGERHLYTLRPREGGALTFLAAMVPYTDRHPEWDWTLHAATAVTALVTLAGTALCFDLWRRAGSVEPDTDTADLNPAALSRFIGFFGLVTGVTNLVLILGEGSYVFFVRRGG